VQKHHGRNDPGRRKPPRSAAGCFPGVSGSRHQRGLHLVADSHSRVYGNMSRRRQPERPVIHANWTLTVAPAWKTSFSDAIRVLDLLQHPETMVQEHDRGSVSFLRVCGNRLVAKRSFTQERRRWTQLTSIYRGGEGARAFRNMSRLREAGLSVPEPVLALEQRRWGLVVASWHAYWYLDGQACTCAHAAMIARTLKQLHDRGWVHRDPHVRNFLESASGTCIIDCARARPWRSGYAKHYDVVLLNKCCPGARELYPGFSATNPLHVLAQWQINWVVRWRRVKRVVRRWAGIRRNETRATPPDGKGERP
jgi:tRNA A-37 threonylcarbamoyl transferase component Bud32